MQSRSREDHMIGQFVAVLRARGKGFGKPYAGLVNAGCQGTGKIASAAAFDTTAQTSSQTPGPSFARMVSSATTSMSGPAQQQES